MYYYNIVQYIFDNITIVYIRPFFYHFTYTLLFYFVILFTLIAQYSPSQNVIMLLFLTNQQPM